MTLTLPQLSPLQPLSELAVIALDEFATPPAQRAAILTGFPELDEICHGLHAGSLCLLAGRPRSCKTSVALSIARHVSRTRPVAYFSLEQQARYVAGRVLAEESGVDPFILLRQRGPSDDEWSHLRDGLESLSAHALHIADGAATTAGEIRARAHDLQSRAGDLGLIVVDSLASVWPHAHEEGHALEMRRAVCEIRMLARELDVPVLGTWPVNPRVDHRANGRPRLADLFLSGSVEPEADLIVILSRPVWYVGDPPGVTLKLDVAKNRFGRCIFFFRDVEADTRVFL